MQRPSERALGPLGYQHQNSRQTLADGLEEYYAANSGKVVRPRDLAAESAALFRSHDICHVVFGLDTSLDDEAIADVRTLLSCDVGWRAYARYMTSDPAAKAIFKELGYVKSVMVTIRAVPRIVRAAIEALRIKKQWPWIPPDSFQRRTLVDLRQEHGIRLV